MIGIAISLYVILGGVYYAFAPGTGTGSNFREFLLWLFWPVQLLIDVVFILAIWTARRFKL